MKVLIVNNNNSVVGGNDAAAINQYNLFKSQSIDTHFFSKDNISNYFNIEDKSSFAKYFFNSDSKNALEKTLHEYKPDLIHIHSFGGVISNSLLSVLKKKKIPSILTVHDYKLICPVSSCLSNNKVCTTCAEEKNAKNVLYKKCNRNSYAYSAVNYLDYTISNNFYDQKEIINHFVFVSQFSYDLHRKFLPQLEEKHSIIPNFFEVKSTHNYSKEPYLLYIGRLSEEKGILQFTKVFTENKNLALKLLIAGEGNLKGELINLAASDERIKLIGFIQGAQKEEVIGKSQFVVLPSQWYENNPISLIESQSLKTPIIGTNIGGIPEIIKDGKNGFLFEPFSDFAIDSVLKKVLTLSNSEYNFLSDASIEKYNKDYTPSVFLRNTLNLYERILSKSPQ